MGLFLYFLFYFTDLYVSPCVGNTMFWALLLWVNFKLQHESSYFVLFQGHFGSITIPHQFYFYFFHRVYSFFEFYFFIVFLQYHLVPLYGPRPCNRHTVVHVHKSFVFFAQPFHSLCSPRLSCHCALCESVSILLLSSVCSLDPTCEWNLMVFAFLWLAYFT